MPMDTVVRARVTHVRRILESATSTERASLGVQVGLYQTEPGAHHLLVLNIAEVPAKSSFSKTNASSHRLLGAVYVEVSLSPPLTSN
ncbi:hypothetical protein CCUS01_03797 [Colletotrichum cuscutae]|uniref:Uncharacterized protein n=1 Tax=Colletotrichum cuscutae TaxID=1209917 RepID=A0AAI9Y855_9PEZI|nr:hypothetical protein CCUS01_03797 [Colletotrichum cuscutae]